jgi:hypothetical protein
MESQVGTHKDNLVLARVEKVQVLLQTLFFWQGSSNVKVEKYSGVTSPGFWHLS